MRTIEDHRREVTALLEPLAEALGSERLEVSGAAIAAHPRRYEGRILAVDVLAPSSLPSFDNSQMDGYAVRSADIAEARADAPVTLVVGDRVAAGDTFSRHEPGTATPIMTGAAVPGGADAVVQIERAIPPHFPVSVQDAPPPTGATRPLVSFSSPVAPGSFVRGAGSDVTEGQVLLRRGTRLGPAQYGVIAGTGATGVEVRRRPRALLVSTGHEIRDPGTELAPGQIFDANTVALTAALLAAGCDVVPRPCRSDDAEDLLALVVSALTADAVDLVVTVGGVSAGTREVVRDAFGGRGVQFMKVAMQPGGPQGFGLADLAGDAAPVPVVCLPGNPVSALVSVEAFLRPALLATLGARDALRETRRGTAAHPFDSPATHHQLRRGTVDADGSVTLVGGPSSHLLHSYAESTVLVHVPLGTTAVAEGDELEFWRIDG